MNNNIDNINGIKRQPVECYSRVVGYFRPINNWNNGKVAEFVDRKEYKNGITKSN